jgi:hypothetical protein
MNLRKYLAAFAILIFCLSAGSAWILGQRPTNAAGYPDIAGEWMEGTNRVHISQTGPSLVATCTYGSVSWRMEGTISRNGVLTGKLVHTAGVSPSVTGYAQDRSLTLSADGRTLEGQSVFAGGAGGHPLIWKRSSPLSPITGTSAPSGYPDVAGEWMEGTNRVRVSQTGANLVATCTYGNVSWRMEGTISRNGILTGKLVHTAGVSPSVTGYAQDRNLTLSADGRTLEGRAVFAGGAGGHALTWKRVAGGEQSSSNQKPANLTGAWVHSADASTQTPGNKVIIIQDGSQITLTQTYKSDGTRRKPGTLTGFFAVSR